MHEAAEKELIVEVLRGDHQAYAVLINRYQRPIFNLLLRMVGCREDAADLSQETFLRAYANLAQFRLSSRFFPWLYAIGMNLARDHLRGKKNAPRTVPLDGPEAEKDCPGLERQPEKRLVDQLDAGRLNQLMARLPVDYREALMLRFHMGLDMRDIGVALGLTTSGAKMRIKRGLAQLRQMLPDTDHRDRRTAASPKERKHG